MKGKGNECWSFGDIFGWLWRELHQSWVRIGDPIFLYDPGVGLFNQLVIVGGEIVVVNSVPINTGTEPTISLSGSTYYCSI